MSRVMGVPPRRFPASLASLGMISLLGGAICPMGQSPATAGQQPVGARYGMGVSGSAPAAEVGLDILKKGGNAVDAAVATAFALAVTYPQAGNIGGGGFMVVFPARGQSPFSEPVVIEY